MAELKPCPFCGAEPMTRVCDCYRSMQKVTLSFAVICPRCAVRRSIGVELCDTDFGKVRQAMNEAEEAWNTRDGEADNG